MFVCTGFRATVLSSNEQTDDVARRADVAPDPTDNRQLSYKDLYPAIK